MDEQKITTHDRNPIPATNGWEITPGASGVDEYGPFWTAYQTMGDYGISGSPAGGWCVIYADDGVAALQGAYTTAPNAMSAAAEAGEPWRVLLAILGTYPGAAEWEEWHTLDGVTPVERAARRSEWLDWAHPSLAPHSVTVIRTE